MTTQEEQAALWNGPADHAWATMQEVLDRMFQPFESMLVEAACHHRANRVLDVGCGAGATTRALARQLGAGGGCLGIDLSAPLIALARSRAEQEGSSARFVCADAGAYSFEPASFDAIVSRFGVMFFDDPVAAFARLRQAAQVGATLRAVVWRSARDNPFMTAAESAAAPLLPGLALGRSGGPGQFALADDARVQRILAASGWSEVRLRRIDVPCTFAERDLLSYLTQLGPLGRLLPQLDEAKRTQVVRVARAALEPYVRGADVCFTAACWRIDAIALGGRDRTVAGTARMSP